MPHSVPPPSRKVRLPDGSLASVPDPLPPPLTWTPALVLALFEADRLIGRLAGEGGRRPNPHLLIRPFVRREAVLSSRIEGTQATLGELLAAGAGVAVERSPADLREVGNYVVALEHGISRLGQVPLWITLLLGLHARLMTGVRGGRASPGRLRTTQNWIGLPGSTLATATYVPSPPADVRPCLQAWERFLGDRTLPPLIQVALAHYQFEAIHPFRDGNGRVGRLFITLFLVGRGLLPGPLLYLSAFFEASRRDYYEGLRGVQERGAWEAWLLYFLAGVARQSEDAASRATRINALLADWRRKVAGASSQVPTRLVDLIAEPPLHREARGRATRGRLHDGPAGDRPAGGGRDPRACGAGQAGSRLLCESPAGHPGGAGRARAWREPLMARPARKNSPSPRGEADQTSLNSSETSSRPFPWK